MTKKTKTKTKTAPKKKPATKWFDHAAKLPVGLFFTTMGPIIGKVDKAPSDMGQFRVRLWAPAMLQVGLAPVDARPGVPLDAVQQRVVFQPLALIETHVDLSAAAPYGRAPVPDSLLPHYEEYFAKFTQGAYELRRVVAKLETEGAHVVDTPIEAQESDGPEVVEAPAAVEDDDLGDNESDENRVS